MFVEGKINHLKINETDILRHGKAMSKKNLTIW